MSPLGDHEYVADLAADFGFPLVVVVPNRIGAINSALLTLIAAKAHRQPLPIAGIVLNDILPPTANDPATRTNRRELELRCSVPILAQLGHGADDFSAPIDWLALTTNKDKNN
jgi:dethiobiotin synthetase